MKVILSTIYLIIVSTGILAQSSVSFTAASDAKQVTSTGYFKVSYILKNAQGTSFQPPNFKKNFTILNGPNRSMSTRIVNGSASSEMTLSYTLQPKSIGTFTLPPASIFANGQKMTSNALKIEVVKGKPKTNNGEQSIEDQVFVKLEVDTTFGYIGQQIIVDYKLYTTINIQNYNIISESDYEGCFIQNIRTFNNRQQREIVDGVQYVTQVLKRVALFPQQNGLIEIEPAQIQLGISTGRSISFFNNVKPHYTSTNGVSINIATLPDTPPSNFTGGVGKFRINSGLSNSTISTDDGVSLRLNVIGDGDMKRISAPILTSPLLPDGTPAFEIYEPTLQNENSYENGGRIEGRKDFEYLLLPKKSGSYIIEPQLSYFDVDSGTYIVLDQYKFPIKVTQGKGIASDKSLTEASIQKNELAPYIANVPLHRTPSFMALQPWFWSIYSLPILGFLGLVGYQEYQKSKGEIDLVELARKKAEKVARKKLSEAEQFMIAKDPGAFYKEVSNAYLGYVHDKLSIQKSDLSKSNVAQHLRSLSVNDEKIKQFVDVINRTEMMMYSGKTSSEDMQTFYDSAIEILIGVEQEITS